MTTPQDFPPEFARQNKGPAILAICSTLTAVASIFVAARLYVRAKILSRVGLDDWLIILSMVCGYVTLGLNIAAVRAGNGRHFVLLTDEQKSGAIKWTMAGFCPGILSFGIPKLAVVALLTKITNPSRMHRIFLWCMSSGCLILLIGCVPLLYTQCTPSRSQWDFSVKGTCWSPWILIYYAIVVGSISGAVDLYLAIYPAVILYGLRINLKKKIALSCALGLGSVATAVAIYKSTRLPALGSRDFSYDTSDITIWTSIEGNSITIAACIPTLQPLLDLILGKAIFGSSGSRPKHAGYKSHNSGRTVELVTIGGSKGNRAPKQHKKMGVSDVTIGGKDSQESILSPRDQVYGDESTKFGQHV
ncbi:integral membrane protein [Ophiobolus disseminans]|uniref:Integral membrane protein n=1 Tax=Ophiobolus disseminans TaxID=1469910 RepID=A0A6A7AKP8_9PLEO|nr:integral membrane protein [Ophiobolus disseminans]